MFAIWSSTVPPVFWDGSEFPRLARSGLADRSYLTDRSEGVWPREVRGCEAVSAQGHDENSEG